MAKTGRPSTYSDQIAAQICARIACGESLRSICRDEGMPSVPTVFSWLASRPDFAKQYARAREEQADVYADEIAEIADANPETVPVYDREGQLIEVKIDTAFEAWRKTRIDARKWIASKLKPKKYGDKLELDARVNVGDAVAERVARASKRG